MEVFRFSLNKKFVLLIFTIFIGAFLSCSIVLFPPHIFIGAYVVILFLIISLIKFDLACALTILILPIAIKAPLGPIHLDVGEYFLLPLLFVGLIKGFSKKNNINSSIFNIPIFAFIISAILSFIIVISDKHAWGEFRIVLIAVLFYLMIKLNYSSKKDVYYLINCIVASAVFVACVGIIQYFTGSLGFNNFVMDRGYSGLIFQGAPSSVRLVNGVFRTFNTFACYLDFIFPLSLVLYISSSNRKKFLYLLCSAIILIGLLMSFSRGGLVALVASVFALAFGYSVIKGVNRLKMIVCVILLVVLSFITLKGLLSNNAYVRTLNLNVRLDIWESTFNAISANPIIGVGLGKAGEHLIYFNRGWGTHNNYLGLLLERGLIGLLSFSIIVILFFRVGYDNIRRVKEANMSLINLGLIAGMVAFLTHGTVDDSFTFLVFQVLFFIFLWAIDIISESSQRKLN